MFFVSGRYKIIQKNISFYKLDDESYDIVDQYLFGSSCYGYEDSYNYYDIKVMMLKLIICYCIKKVIMNVILDITMYLEWKLPHYN